MENSYTKKSLDVKAFLALVIFGVTLVGGMVYAKPLLEAVQSMQKGRDEKAAERDLLNTQLNDLQRMQQELNLQSEVSRETNLNAIPVGFYEESLIRDLNMIADQSNVTMNGLSFGIPSDVQDGEVGKVTISTNVTGQQADLLTFLRGIEADSRKIVVKSIAVQFGKTDQISLVNFNVQMEAYFQGTNK